MGQAKQRGTLEERIKQSIKTKEEHLKNNPPPPRPKLPLKTAMLLGSLIAMSGEPFGQRNRF